MTTWPPQPKPLSVRRKVAVTIAVLGVVSLILLAIFEFAPQQFQPKTPAIPQCDFNGAHFGDPSYCSFTCINGRDADGFNSQVCLDMGCLHFDKVLCDPTHKSALLPCTAAVVPIVFNRTISGNDKLWLYDTRGNQVSWIRPFTDGNNFTFLGNAELHIPNYYNVGLPVPADYVVEVTTPYPPVTILYRGFLDIPQVRVNYTFTNELDWQTNNFFGLPTFMFDYGCVYHAQVGLRVAT